jgi:hypothetical protein
VTADPHLAGAASSPVNPPEAFPPPSTITRGRRKRRRPPFTIIGLEREPRPIPQHFFAMSSKPSSARRQRSSRRRVRHSAIPARLLLPHAPSIKCTIVALSTEGACLALGAAPRLPINLQMRAAGSVYRVQVAERGVGYVFVRFRSEQSRRRAT